MSFFKRLFKVGESEVHAVIDKLEDPIKMTEQGIRDLKKDLSAAMTSLAEVKGIAIRTRKEADKRRFMAEDYERKAMLVLQKMQQGELAQDQAEQLATEIMNKKEEVEAEARRLHQDAVGYEQQSNDLQAKVGKLKSTITSYENDLVTLKARARTAASTKKINAQLARVDSSSTIAMLEKMKAKVEEDESLSQAYGEIGGMNDSLDSRIDAAVESKPALPGASAGLLELKKKMGIE